MPSSLSVSQTLRVVAALYGVVLVAAAAAIVFHYRIGPVVLVLTPTHGVHSGDFIGLAAALVGGALLYVAARR